MDPIEPIAKPIAKTGNKLSAAFRDFLELESAGGIVLAIAAVLAIIAANSPWQDIYQSFLTIPGAVEIGSAVEIRKPLLLWVNDLWMAIFFFLVGLEIKREFLEGELSSLGQVALPGIAAIGGMVVPALIYVAVNFTSPLNLNGWAIPAATDIAFALAVLSLLGNRVPSSLKILLLAIAIFDDLGAILIIAFFYTANLSLLVVALSIVPIIVLVLMNLAGVRNIVPYILVGGVLWVIVLKSGVHATLAGVITAFAIPLMVKRESGESPLKAAGARAACLGRLPGAADVCVCQRRRFAGGHGHGQPDGAGDARHHPGAGRRQAGRHFQHALSDHPARLGEDANQRELDPALWRGSPRRYRLHHEPVHRRPGLRACRL